tara:strand:- start:222 stop:491 length:270 start_codon:yes stop_codon:yes gene_type:complete
VFCTLRRDQDPSREGFLIYVAGRPQAGYTQSSNLVPSFAVRLAEASVWVVVSFVAVFLELLKRIRKLMDAVWESHGARLLTGLFADAVI